MNTKQLFHLALLTRLASLLCLALFFFLHLSELEMRTQLLALGLSFTGWILGSFFLGLFHSAQAVALENELTAVVGATIKVVTDVTDGEEKPSHPLFKDDDNE